MTSQQGRSRQLMALGILLVLAMVSITSVNAAVDIDYANLEKRGTVFVSSFCFLDYLFFILTFDHLLVVPQGIMKYKAIILLDVLLFTFVLSFLQLSNLSSLRQ
jgi:hypothetical protein